jgi:hypothetical protein
MSSWYQLRNGSFQTPSVVLRIHVLLFAVYPYGIRHVITFIPASRVYTLRRKDTSK